jgi:hypothetical protein
VNVPVVGGHAGVTILPLFSQVVPTVVSIISCNSDNIDLQNVLS